jgi:hypothetical protein
MKKTISKLFLGNPEYNIPARRSAYFNYILNLKQLWHNKKHHDIGFERILRLFLVAVQIIFPGIHIRNYFDKRGVVTRNVAIEFYVMLKMLLPFVFLAAGWYKSMWTIWVSIYLLLETILYVSSLIFVSDIFVKPRSYRRNILMLFFNYMEICLCFSVIYAGFHLLNENAKSIVDYIYFSIITSTTVGYGDIYPVTKLGKIMVSVHALMIVSFIVLFLNFFSSKVEVMHKKDDY